MSGVARSEPPTRRRPQLVSRDSRRRVTTNVCIRPIAGRVNLHYARLARTCCHDDDTERYAIKIRTTAKLHPPSLPLHCIGNPAGVDLNRTTEVDHVRTDGRMHSNVYFVRNAYIYLDSSICL